MKLINFSIILIRNYSSKYITILQNIVQYSIFKLNISAIMFSAILDHCAKWMSFPEHSRSRPKKEGLLRRFDCMYLLTQQIARTLSHVHSRTPPETPLTNTGARHGLWSCCEHVSSFSHSTKKKSFSRRFFVAVENFNFFLYPDLLETLSEHLAFAAGIMQENGLHWSLRSTRREICSRSIRNSFNRFRLLFATKFRVQFASAAASLRAMLPFLSDCLNNDDE